MSASRHVLAVARNPALRPRPQRRVRWLLVGLPVGVVIVFVSLLVAAEVVDHRAGCGSVDPTDPANYSEINVLNDTSETVGLDDCVGAGCHTDPPVRLASGRLLTEDAACAASGADMTSWRVTHRRWPGPRLHRGEHAAQARRVGVSG